MYFLQSFCRDTRVLWWVVDISLSCTSGYGKGTAASRGSSDKIFKFIYEVYVLYVSIEIYEIINFLLLYYHPNYYY